MKHFYPKTLFFSQRKTVNTSEPSSRSSISKLPAISSQLAANHKPDKKSISRSDSFTFRNPDASLGGIQQVEYDSELSSHFSFFAAYKTTISLRESLWEK